MPLRRHGNYTAIVLLIYSIGTTLGPFIAGTIVEFDHWRWVFYINLPVGAVSFTMLFRFLHVNYRRDSAWVD